MSKYLYMSIKFSIREMRFYTVGKKVYVVFAPRPSQAGRIGWAEAHPTYLTERQELLLVMMKLQKLVCQQGPAESPHSYHPCNGQMTMRLPPQPWLIYMVTIRPTNILYCPVLSFSGQCANMSDTWTMVHKIDHERKGCRGHQP